jgi:hypothetical protein
MSPASGINNHGTESDMVLRNSNSGALELYDISNNQITGAFVPAPDELRPQQNSTAIRSLRRSCWRCKGNGETERLSDLEAEVVQ